MGGNGWLLPGHGGQWEGGQDDGPACGEAAGICEIYTYTKVMLLTSHIARIIRKSYQVDSIRGSCDVSLGGQGGVVQDVQVQCCEGWGRYLSDVKYVMYL